MITILKENTMKYLDGIEIITDKYEKFGIPKGTRGAIVLPEIRGNTFECELFNAKEEEWEIHVADMIVTRESPISNDEIQEDLPKQDPRWWCKVENGFILNLLGEKKNKIPYDYDS